MIISRTPFRVSFAGGGTDLEAYYKFDGGAVTSTAINKHMYVTVNQKFDDEIRVSYSKTEFADHVDDIKHELVREAMKMTGVTKGVEITTIAEVPSRGTGLGSSSSLTVGLLNALYAFKGQYKPRHVLAEQACQIEIDILGAPIGKQDQFIAAYGGLQHIQFKPDGRVTVDPIICSYEVKQRLEQNLLMFYTGLTRSSHDILDEQKSKSEKKKEDLDELKRLSKEVRNTLSRGEVEKVGEYLHQGWLKKRELASKISNPEIDRAYQAAIEAGAIGGKLLGAGGGGFILLYCEKKNQDKVRKALSQMKEMPFEMDPEGTKILYI